MAHVPGTACKAVPTGRVGKINCGSCHPQTHPYLCPCLSPMFQALFVVVLAPPPPRLKDFPLGLHFVLSPWVLCSSRETRWQEEHVWGLVAPAVHLCSALRCLFGHWLVSRICPRHHYENLFNGMSFERRKETVGEER